MQRRDFLAAGAALAALGAAGAARAQTLPGNAFIISGFPPGGMGDYVARPVADRLRGKYASNVLVDARVGAGGRIATDYAKRAAPDGLTILQIPSGVMTLYPHTYKKLSYDPLNDFIPVTSTVSYQFVVTAGPGLPAEIRTLPELLKWAKANPGQANYGVPAAGSALHFAGMMLTRESGVEMKAVPYRGGAPLLADVMGGQIPVSINVLGEVLPYIKAGKLRGLAVTSAQRSPFLADVPTLVELGYKDIVVQEYLGWFLPARTPPEIVNRLNAQVREALQAPEYIKALAENGLIPLHQSPDDFARIVRGDHQRWATIVKASGFTAED